MSQVLGALKIHFALAHGAWSLQNQLYMSHGGWEALNPALKYHQITQFQGNNLAGKGLSLQLILFCLLDSKPQNIAGAT